MNLLTIFLIISNCLLLTIIFIGYYFRKKILKKSTFDNLSLSGSGPTNCLSHQNELAKGSCMICGEYWCADCIKTHKNLNFCTQHFLLFNSSTWDQALNIKTSENNSENGLILYKFKENIWNKQKFPTFIQTHYKINLEEDYIETYISLYCIKSDLEKIRKQFDSFSST